MNAANVASFTINHDKMKKGIFVSRKDKVGDQILTTLDLRMKTPNTEPPLDNAAIHTLEHLMATYLRGSESGIADKVIYVGPMGCRTGMYLILNGDYDSRGVQKLIASVFRFAAHFNDKIPATSSRECGNYLDHSLAYANYEALKYLEVLNNMSDDNFEYPVD